MRSSVLSKLFWLVAIVTLTFGSKVQAQVYNPIALTPGSYTQSIIVPQTATNVVPLCDAATATVGAGTNNASTTWYEMGYNTNAPATGLPHPGATITGQVSYLSTVAAPITWTVATISGITDVNTTGTLVSAYDWEEPGQTINGVPFTESTSASAGNFSMTSGFASLYAGVGGGTTAPFSTLPSAYQTLLSGEVYGSTSSTCTLTGLIAGHSYLVQFWANDSRSCCDTRTETIASGGGNTIMLDYNATFAAGGLGQVVTGTFTASSNTQAITFTGDSTNKVTQINAAQLRDVTVTALTNVNFQFTMPSSYATSNAVLIDSTVTNGTLTLNTPTLATNISILCAASAVQTINYAVHHSNGQADDTGTFIVPSWLTASSNLMYEAQGYLNTSSSGAGFAGVNANASGPCLYGPQITVSGANPVTGISFTNKSGSGHACIFALSGNDAGTNWTPMLVTGYDEDMVTEQAVAQPSAFTNFTTATMDNGTGNTGNTFYEVGFNRVSPTTGLPHAGTTFTSISHPNRTYMMAPSFQSLAPDSILISSNVPSATIVPAVPAAYTAFSVVSAGANIGSSIMSNTLIMQHADGVTETNLFLAYDWFSTLTAALTNKAFTSVGRFNVNNPGTFNDTLTNDDQLFESTFLLKDTTSPVTNMTIKYASGPANCTAYIFAVSATAGGFPPVIATQPQSQEWYPSQTATFTVTTSAGTAPLTNIWLVESNGLYYPLTNGVDGNGSTVSGATTTTMSISGLTMADGTNYEVIITNAVGSVTSSPALLTINPGTPVAPIIDSQIPPASASTLTVLTNQLTGFSVVIDGTSAQPISYQWYVGVPGGPASAIPNGTNAKYLYVNTTNTTLFCIASNFVGTATSSPVSLAITNPTPYEAAILAYNPVAYWPLTETTGNVAYDVAGGNNGIYEGAFSLGQPGIPATAGIGTNSSVNFDGATAYVDIPEGNLNITNQMTVIQWVQTTFNGNQFVTTMGHGNASYRLGFSPSAHGGNNGAHFADQAPDVISPNAINDGNWHQLVGVYSVISNTPSEYLYVDGQLEASSSAVTAPTGSAYDVWIGGAPDYATPGSTRFLAGNSAQVAILTNALTSNQVAAIYYSLGLPPTVSITPANPEIYTNGDITFTAKVTGTPPLGIQWYSVDTSFNSNIISGATNSTYTIDQPSLSLNGYTYGIIVTNIYGSAQTSVVLTVKAPSGLYALTVLGDNPIAYWPLDESPDNGAGNNGTTAIDIVNGDNGYYTNTVIGVTPNTYPPNSFPITVPFGLADSDTNYAEFGQLTDPTVGAVADNYVAGINGINFGTPTNTATNFSVEAWVYLNANNTAGAGIVSQGYGNGGEQFAMDLGGGANAFRFYWRDASGATHGNASPSGPPALNTWYHVVGVLCETSNYVEIFTNGVLGESNRFTTASPAGVLQLVYPISIGARQPSEGSDYSMQLSGSVADVAIYNYALSPAQIANHYLSSGIVPLFTAQPTNASVGDGGNVTFYSSALGSLPISYQWYDSTLNQAISGATSSNYTLVGASYNTLNNEQYYVVASNIYGATTSSVVTLSVIGGAPQVSLDVLPSYTVSFGAPLTVSAVFLGTTPLTYQWLYNGAPLTGPRFSGLTSNTLTIFPTLVSDSGTYQLFVSNAFGTNYSGMASVTVLPYLTFSTSGSGWSYNYNTADPFGGYIASNVLELTDGNGDEAISSFSSNQVYIGSFAASFIYTVSGSASADGMTFVLQNDPRGPGALGAAGGALGYSSGAGTTYNVPPAITPSVALEFNLYTGATVFDDEANEISINTNGFLGDTGTGLLASTSPVFFSSGDPISVSIVYTNAAASLVLQDLSTTEIYSNNIPINIPAVLGTNLAYVGFTAGDGQSTSIQQISSFSFTNFVSTNFIYLNAAKSGTNLLLSWPAVAGYQLQSIGDLSKSATPSAWQNVTTAVILTNGTSEVVIPFPAHPEFYRLQLQ